VTSRTQRLLTVSAAVLTVAWVAFLLWMQPDTPPRTARPDPGYPLPLSKKGLAPVPAAALTDSTDGQGDKDGHLARLDQWLETRGRDARALIAVWEITGRRDLLQEAVRRFPNDPAVCLAIIATTPGKFFISNYKEQLLPWIERLMAAEPHNPEGLLLKSWLLSVTGDHPAAFAAARDAVAIGRPRDNHLAARVETIREALASTGATDANPWTLALRSPLTMGHNALIPSRLKFTLPNEAYHALRAGDEASAIAAWGVARDVAALYLQTPGRTLHEELEAHVVQLAPLRHFRDDLILGPDGLTVAQARQAMEEARRPIMELHRQRISIARFYDNSPLAIQTEYTRRIVEQSQYHAAQWITATWEKPPPAPPAINPDGSLNIFPSQPPPPR